MSEKTLTAINPSDMRLNNALNLETTAPMAGTLLAGKLGATVSP
jgi:hypothetical protein